MSVSYYLARGLRGLYGPSGPLVTRMAVGPTEVGQTVDCEGRRYRIVDSHCYAVYMSGRGDHDCLVVPVETEGEAKP